MAKAKRVKNVKLSAAEASTWVNIPAESFASEKGQMALLKAAQLIAMETEVKNLFRALVEPRVGFPINVSLKGLKADGTGSIGFIKAAPRKDPEAKPKAEPKVTF